MIFRDNEHLNEALTYYKELLNLQDWKIRAIIVRESQMHFNGASGEHHTDVAVKESLIHILDPTDVTDNCFEEDHELVLVHELMHLHLCLWLTKRPSLEDLMMERTVEALAQVIVKMRKMLKEQPSWAVDKTEIHTGTELLESLK